MAATRYAEMLTPADKLRSEVSSLWIEVYDLPPPTEFDASRLLDILVRNLPVVPYDRLCTAALASNLVWPANLNAGVSPSGAEPR